MLATSVISDPAVSFGAGVNVSTITGSGASVNSSSPRIGYSLKAGLEQNFSERFTLRTGVSIETRGENNNSSKIYDESYSDEQVEKLQILNLQLPVLAQVNFSLGSVGINIFGGPELGIFLNGERKSEITSKFAAIDTFPARSAVAYDTLDFSRDMKMLDAGIRIGVGFEMKTGAIGAFFLRPSAYIGLVDILQTNHEAECNANLVGKHQAFEFAIGYKFNIHQKMSDASDYKSSKKSPSSEKSSTESNIDGYRNYTTGSSQEGTNSGYGDSSGDE
jgi:hypothetical protein